jgi:hypothetical protein
MQISSSIPVTKFSLSPLGANARAIIFGFKNHGKSPSDRFAEKVSINEGAAI